MSMLWVFAAGGAGSLCRYLLWMALTQPESRFPSGTLAVNLAGCFAIGFAGSLIGNPDLRLAVITGFLGGFTTFSAFSLETLTLWRNGAAAAAVIYVLASNLGGLAAAWAGWRAGSLAA
jgi:fluoride exporter